MNEQFLDLEKLKDRPLTLKVDYPASQLEADDDQYTFPGKVTGEVIFTRVSQDVMGHGRLEVTVRCACARCLTPTDVRVTAPIDELWVKQVIDKRHPADDEEEDEIEPDLTHLLTGDRIELSDIFRDVLLAELPDRALCSEGCKGLCPQCGANLNAETCHCPTDAEGEKIHDVSMDWKSKIKDVHLDS